MGIGIARQLVDGVRVPVFGLVAWLSREMDNGGAEGGVVTTSKAVRGGFPG
jgi:hypothetical protein